MASEKWVRFRSILKSYPILSYVLTVGMNGIAFYGTRVCFTLMDRLGILNYHDLSITAIDGYFEQNAAAFRWFILLYSFYFVFWLGGYWILAGQDRPAACSFLAAATFGEIITMIIFLVLPTRMERPALDESNIRNLWDWITSLIYAADTPDNLFPSLHCFNSWMVFRGSLRYARLPKGYKLFSMAAAMAICASTLFVRQHLFADMVSGIALAELSLFLERKLHFGRIYERLEKRIRKEATA